MSRCASAARHAFVVGVLVLGASCAPKPTALERYCDVVHQAEATFDPLSRPGATGDPAALRKALDDQVQTLAAMSSSAPDAVRADVALARDDTIALANALSLKGYVADAIQNDPKVASLLADTKLADARQRIAQFNAGRCP